MHLFFLSRGMKWHRDKFIETLASLHVPYKLKDTEGKEETRATNVLLQPIEMWSLVFPEENLDTMLRTLNPKTNQFGVTSKKFPKFSSPKRKLALAGLRKALGLKKIPDWKPEGNKFPVYKQHIDVIGIGIKEDYRNEYGNECL